MAIQNEDKGQKGVLAYLEAFKRVLGNPLSRAFLRSVLRSCSTGERTMPSLYWALGAYAGENLDYPLSVRFHTQTIERRMKLGIGLTGGKEETVKKAVPPGSLYQKWHMYRPGGGGGL